MGHAVLDDLSFTPAAYFGSADPTGTSLVCPRFPGADFRGATLKKAVLRDADGRTNRFEGQCSVPS
ncbi:uncharacterized protein YjbI with pentapeptide repeats [Kitasatospora sp. MAP12-15]|uniref:pentapeptide repeat-containing protein n=1 Tax=unclassified Kitasatospora TaxID=2633591 RepID=UPI0024770CBF|nr:pentapeptide repeat-containing protein [Kitasatospora sp. MAP12-44]MDH6108328.1 uncharacterized protein YjbI with pentapeptide repeats [Kitasatospora sp. MAP12-44]